MYKYRSKSIQVSVNNINNPLHSFVLGTILGAGYITKSGLLQIDQSILQYTQWKYDVLNNVISAAVAEVKRKHVKTKKETISYRFYTKFVFEEWREAFYLESITGGKATKKLPCNIESLLIHPLSLAVWFMDDGGKGENTPHGVIISVYKFSGNEISVL